MHKVTIEEIWKPIPIEEYVGLYEVSNLSRVRSLDRLVKCHSGYRLAKGQILKQSLVSGYYQVTLSKNQKSQIFKVHRLVAMAFVPNPNNLPCVNHKDECKTNNVYTNLEWCDAKYNTNYGTRNERIKNKLINKAGKRVMCVETGEEFQSLRFIQRTYGYHYTLISKVCRGLKKTAYGHHWKFID